MIACVTAWDCGRVVHHPGRRPRAETTGRSQSGAAHGDVRRCAARIGPQIRTRSAYRCRRRSRPIPVRSRDRVRRLRSCAKPLAGKVRRDVRLQRLLVGAEARIAINSIERDPWIRDELGRERRQVHRQPGQKLDHRCADVLARTAALRLRNQSRSLLRFSERRNESVLFVNGDVIGATDRVLAGFAPVPLEDR